MLMLMLILILPISYELTECHNDEIAHNASKHLIIISYILTVDALYKRCSSFSDKMTHSKSSADESLLIK